MSRAWANNKRVKLNGFVEVKNERIPTLTERQKLVGLLDGGEDFALADPLRTRMGAHRIGGFEYAQRFRPRNQVDRQQRLGRAARRQLFRLEFHQEAAFTWPERTTPSIRRRIEAAISRRSSAARISRSVVVPVASVGGAT